MINLNVKHNKKTSGSYLTCFAGSLRKYSPFYLIVLLIHVIKNDRKQGETDYIFEGTY